MKWQSIWSKRPPIIKWWISSSRDQKHGAVSPVKHSKYFKYLSKIGAGWKNE